MQPPLIKLTTAALAPWQERLAKELLLARLAGEVSLADVARECRLSRSHFSKAFKASTGSSPHAWLTRQRIDRARSQVTAFAADGVV